MGGSRGAGDLVRMAGLVRRGEWTTYGDVSAAARGDKRAARAVGAAAARDPRFPSPHRVLAGGGVISRPGDASSEGGLAEIRRRLESEGIGFDKRGRADPARHVHWDELAHRAGRAGRLALPDAGEPQE